MRTLLLACLVPLLVAADWPEFRGPGGVGVYAGPALPTEWGPTTNVAWEVAVPGKGWSSPVLIGDRLFLTTAVPDDAESPKSYSLRALAIDAKTGKTLWDREVFVEDLATAPKLHRKNSHASPTPVADAESVWVHFGPNGTARLTHAGDIVWKSTEHRFDPVHGAGASPILEQGLIVFPADGKDDPALVALDAATGKTRWRTPRESSARMSFSFATCLAVDTPSGRVILSPASDVCLGIDPATGQERFRVRYPKAGWSLICRPVMAGGLAIVATGYVNQHLIAFKPDGTGDLTESVVWQTSRNAPNTPAPVVVGTEIYVVADNGILSCLDAATGKVHYAERLAGRAYSASPVVINGKLYVTSEDGIGQVLELGTTFQPVAKSTTGEPTFATFVPAADGLYLRTATRLFKFQAD